MCQVFISDCIYHVSIIVYMYITSEHVDLQYIIEGLF